MKLKTGFNIFITSILSFLLFSCLGSTEDVTTEVPIDTQITAFYLTAADSISGLDSVVFSIDHTNGQIFNHDSMAYGTILTPKIIVNFTTEAAGVLNVTDGDSTWISTGDSLDLNSPVRLKVYAYDGISTKFYDVKLNIHQVDPDSVYYSQIAVNQSFLNANKIKSVYFQKSFYTFTLPDNDIRLYRSPDAIDWTELTLNGLPSNTSIREIQSNGTSLWTCSSSGKFYHSSNVVQWEVIDAPYPAVVVLGYIRKSATQPGGWAVVLNKEGKYVSAFYTDAQNWLLGDEIPSSFPLSDFSSLSLYSSWVERVTVIGGKSASGTFQNAVWSTTDGLYWGLLTDNVQNLFPPMQGANVIFYNEKLLLMNGKLVEDGSLNTVIYRSIDGGATWQTELSKYYFPESYPARYDASVVVSSENQYMYIIGGRDTGVRTDIWNGVVNKLTF